MQISRIGNDWPLTQGIKIVAFGEASTWKSVPQRNISVERSKWNFLLIIGIWGEWEWFGAMYEAWWILTQNIWTGRTKEFHFWKVGMRGSSDSKSLTFFSVFSLLIIIFIICICWIFIPIGSCSSWQRSSDTKFWSQLHHSCQPSGWFESDSDTLNDLEKNIILATFWLLNICNIIIKTNKNTRQNLSCKIIVYFLQALSINICMRVCDLGVSSRMWESSWLSPFLWALTYLTVIRLSHVYAS